MKIRACNYIFYLSSPIFLAHALSILKEIEGASKTVASSVRKSATTKPSSAVEHLGEGRRRKSFHFLMLDAVASCYNWHSFLSFSSLDA